MTNHHEGAPVTTFRSNGLRVPHPERLSPNHPMYEEIMRRHTAACESGEMGYMDPISGLFAMTAEYLGSRPCCDRGCRHCPYVK